MKTPSMLGPAWAAMAGWGAGLIALALGAGALSAEGTSVIGIGVALVASGGAAIAWGAATLARGRVTAPRAGVAASIVGIVLLTVAMSLAPTRISVLAVTAGALLLIVAGTICAITVRRSRGGERGRSRIGGSRRGVLGVLTGAVVVAALVTPALAATEAGQLAPDHSEHSFVNEHEH